MKGFLLVLALSLIPTIPFYYFGEPLMYQCHDYIIHPARLALIESAFRQGTLIPNWLTGFSFGFGSPAMLFSWFLPYYPALFFRLLGVSIVDSVKLIFLLSTAVSGLGIYLLARKLTDKTAALAAVAFFLISPFRLNLTFTRCSFGETFAQMFVPFVFVFFLSKHKAAPFLAAITLSLLIVSHFLTFMFTVALLIIWFVLVGAERKKIIIAGLGSLLLAVFYWVPSFVEQGLTYYADVSKLWYVNQFVSLRALFNSPWQYGPPQPDNQALSMSFQIGKVHWLIILLTPVLWLRKKGRVAAFFVIAFLVSIFLQLKISKPLWDNLNFAQIITFPWRLQTVSTFCVAILAAMIVSVLPFKKLIVSGLLVALLAANRNHFPASRGNFAGDQYLKDFGFNGGSYIEYMPKGSDLEEYSRLFKEQPKNIPIILNGSGIEVRRANIEPTKITVVTSTDREVSAIIRQYNFPGWTGRIDGKGIALGSDRGLITVNVPAGEHKLALSFEQTPVRKITLFISLISFAVWILSFIARCTGRRKATGGT